MSRLSSENVKELASGHLGRLLLKYSWPALVAMSLNALYSVVDRFYIGQGCGESAMAALTLAMPITMLLGAFGVFVGAGHAAVLSIKLGEKDMAACEKIVGEVVALKLLFFFTLLPLIFFNLDTILGWCGGTRVNPAAFSDAKLYMQIVLFSHVFSHLSFGLSAQMRAEGSAMKSMTCMIVGFGTNLVLDPIFIFGLKMGIAGAAWATNIAMFCSFLFAAWYYLSGKSVVALKLKRIWIYPKLLLKASGIGFSPFFQQLLGSLINVSLAAAFAKWAVDEASATTQIASLGVFQSALILTIMPILGAQQGIQPIIGYNWGARNYKRVRSALMLGLGVTTVLCVLATILLAVPPFPELVTRMFVSSDNTKLIEIASRDLQLSNCMLWCIGLNIVATTFFQSIGKPMLAVILSTMRQGFVMLPIIWLLPYFMANKTLAIWLCMPVSDVACCLLTIVPIYLYQRFLSRIRSSRMSAIN